MNKRKTEPPQVEQCFPELMDLAGVLAQQYKSGKLNSVQEISTEARSVLMTPEIMGKVDERIPGWKAMSECADGQTLIHIVCAFIALLSCREYQTASNERKRLLKWIVLLHDLGKRPEKGKRDFTHAFLSAAAAARIMPLLGFDATENYGTIIEKWSAFTESAVLKQNDTFIQDNSKLRTIVDGIEGMFGADNPASDVVKTTLFHLSLEGEKDWPCPAPLNDRQIRQFINPRLLQLLATMMVVDSAAWNLFDPSKKERYRSEILASMEKVGKIAGHD